MKKTNHLDFDLGFMDASSHKSEDTASKTAHKPSVEKPAKKINWKNILIVVGVIVVLTWMGNSDSGTTEQKTSNSASDGEYTCSEYHHQQAALLSENLKEQEIDSEKIGLENRSDQIDELETRIDSSTVNENSSQYSINQYNAMVDDYNSKLTSYKRDAASYKVKLDAYNAKIDAYNKYLETNCEKK